MRKKLVPWLWRSLYLSALYVGLLFFLDHSSGPDPLGKMALTAIILLGAGTMALALNPPLWATPKRLTDGRTLAAHMFVMFLVASAILRVTEAFTIDRAWILQSALRKCFQQYGMYPVSLAELGELAAMGIPPTASLRHPGQFRYQRFGEDGGHYILRFDSAMFVICSQTDRVQDLASGWRCTTNGNLPSAPPDTDA